MNLIAKCFISHRGLQVNPITLTKFVPWVYPETSLKVLQCTFYIQITNAFFFVPLPVRSCTIPYARLLEQNTEKSNWCPKSWKQIENAFICSVNGRWPIILGIIMKIWE